MKKVKISVVAAKEDTSHADWFKGLTKKQQSEYVRLHPGSKLAKAMTKVKEAKQAVKHALKKGEVEPKDSGKPAGKPMGGGGGSRKPLTPAQRKAAGLKPLPVKDSDKPVKKKRLTDSEENQRLAKKTALKFNAKKKAKAPTKAKPEVKDKKPVKTAPAKKAKVENNLDAHAGRKPTVKGKPKKSKK